MSTPATTTATAEPNHRCATRGALLLWTMRKPLATRLDLVVGPGADRDTVERIAGVFQQLQVRFLATVEEHAHLPGPGEYLRILDGHFVTNRVSVGERIALRELHVF